MDDGAAVLSSVFHEPSQASTEQLALSCRFLGTIEDSLNIIEMLSSDQLSHSFGELLKIALEGQGDDDTSQFDLRRSRLALRILVNACNRSKRLAEACDKKWIIFFRALLRIEEVRVEAFAVLVAVARNSHLNFALSNDYIRLLEDAALLWESFNERSWISAFFSIILEIDYAFLAHSFGDFQPEAFTSLLNITETLLDSSETDVKLIIHPNNVLFCVVLIERILFDFGEYPNHPIEYVEQLVYAMQIIANAALRPKEYGEELLEKTEAVSLISDLLECVLHAQALAEEADMAANPPMTHPDRPDVASTPRIPRVESDNRLLATSSAILRSSSNIRAELKCAAVVSIGNLCCNSRANQLTAGLKHAVIRVLHCTKKTPIDKPFITQWAITAVRHLVHNCAENQDILLAIDQKPMGIIDKEKLLRELGFDVTVDQHSGNIVVKRRKT